MAKNGRDLVATRTLDVHEVRVWMLHQALELVLAFFFRCEGMQQIFC